jgi:hypothetical protein
VSPERLGGRFAYNLGTMKLTKTSVSLRTVSSGGGHRDAADGNGAGGGALVNCGRAVLTSSPVWRNATTGFQAEGFGGGVMKWRRRQRRAGQLGGVLMAPNA